MHWQPGRSGASGRPAGHSGRCWLLTRLVAMVHRPASMLAALRRRGCPGGVPEAGEDCCCCCCCAADCCGEGRAVRRAAKSPGPRLPTNEPVAGGPTNALVGGAPTNALVGGPQERGGRLGVRHGRQGVGRECLLALAAAALAAQAQAALAAHAQAALAAQAQAGQAIGRRCHTAQLPRRPRPEGEHARHPVLCGGRAGGRPSAAGLPASLAAPPGPARRPAVLRTMPLPSGLPPPRGAHLAACSS